MVKRDREPLSVKRIRAPAGPAKIQQICLKFCAHVRGDQSRAMAACRRSSGGARRLRLVAGGLLGAPGNGPSSSRAPANIAPPTGLFSSQVRTPASWRGCHRRSAVSNPSRAYCVSKPSKSESFACPRCKATMEEVVRIAPLGTEPGFDAFARLFREGLKCPMPCFLTEVPLRASTPLPLIAMATSCHSIQCWLYSKEVEAQVGSNRNRTGSCSHKRRSYLHLACAPSLTARAISLPPLLV
jgi:hypothetical protein